MFDFAVFSFFPKGMYLAEKLSQMGCKTAYIELLPKRKSPFGFFVEEDFKEEKSLLEQVGFLFRQEGGFCLLSPKGVWPLQDMRDMAGKHPVLANQLRTNSVANFKHSWLSFLSLNLLGKIFEYNNSQFADKGLNFFSDYFLFEPSLEKISCFQKDHPEIAFYSVLPENISFESDKPVAAKKFLWLVEPHLFPLPDKKNRSPLLAVDSSFFKVDFSGYEDTVPTHFVSIKDISLPWSHDNLLSVFHHKGRMQVWMRVPFRAQPQFFVQGAKKHLLTFFKDGSFDYVKRAPFNGPFVYGPESLPARAEVLKKETLFKNRSPFTAYFKR